MTFDLRIRHRLIMTFIFAAALVLTIVILALLVTITSKVLSPVPVVARCEQNGRSFVYESTVSPQGTNEQAVRFFLRRFIGLYIERQRSSVISEELSLMTTPSFEVAQRAGAWEPPAWKDNNIKTDFALRTISLSGALRAGSLLQVMGTGELLFHSRSEIVDTTDPAIGVFFQATVLVHRVTERTPHGLLVHWLDLSFFENEELLREFLEKAEQKP